MIDTEKELTDFIYKFFIKNGAYYFDVERFNPLGNQAIEVGHYGGNLCVNLHFYTKNKIYKSKNIREIKSLPQNTKQKFIEYIFTKYEKRRETF